MPRSFVPKKSGVHRTACFALYRALLRQTFKLPIPQQSKDQLKNQVKIKTKENSRLQGHWKTTIALRLGYEVLDAIQDEHRRPAVLERVSELSAPPVRRFPRARQRTSSKSPKIESRPAPSSSTVQHGHEPYGPSVLSRPYPNVSGQRRIPRLVNANRYPMLRIKKPESPALGGLIRSRLRERERRIRQTERFEDLTQLGREEDDWDLALKDEFGPDLMDRDKSWATESVRVHDDIRIRHSETIEKRKRTARLMTQIVEEERLLAQREGKPAFKKTRDVKGRIQFLIRHGRAQEARVLAEQTEEKRLNSMKDGTTPKATEGAAPSAVELQRDVKMASRSGKTISVPPMYADRGNTTNTTQISNDEMRDRERLLNDTKSFRHKSIRGWQDHRGRRRGEYGDAADDVHGRAADQEVRSTEAIDLRTKSPAPVRGGLSLAEVLGESK